MTDMTLKTPAASPPREGVLVRLSQTMVAFSERWFPDAYIFVLLATVAVALAAIVQPSLFVFENHYVHLETGGEVTRGMTIADIHNVSRKPPNARVAVGIDVDGFWNWFVDLFGDGK